LFIGGFLALLLRYEAQVNDIHTHTHAKIASEGSSAPLVVIDERQMAMQMQQKDDKQQRKQKPQSRPTNQSGGLFKERVRERPWSSNVPSIDHLLLSPESRARNSHTAAAKVIDASSNDVTMNANTSSSSFTAKTGRGGGERERSIGTASGMKCNSSRGSRGGGGRATTAPKPTIAVSAWGDLENMPNEQGVTWALPPIPTQHAICSSKRGMVECVRAGLFAWREFDARGGGGGEESEDRCTYFDFIDD